MSRTHPRSGDLYVFTETAGHDVQWAVLERRAGRRLVVPADLERQVGSHDVAVPPGTPCGALTLRCRFEVWLGEGAFDPFLRTGRLPGRELALARGKLEEIRRGGPLGSALERETDEETVYLDHAEELAGARAALATSDSPRLF